MRKPAPTFRDALKEARVSGVSILVTTIDKKDKARALARAAFAERLAACVQIMPIDSIYAWQGKIEESAELLLLCKIKRADYGDVAAAIAAIHPYTTPEIVEIPIEAGSADYFAWIDAVTR